MTPEQQAAYLNVQAVLAQIEMQGMIAANQEREAKGHTQAYGEYAFVCVRDDLAAKIDRTVF